MLHLDGSRHAWLALVPEEKQTLIQMVDDATSRLLYTQLWPGETTRAVMTAMREVVREHGIPESFYTDRAGWAFKTPQAGGKVSKTHLTQVGEALARLGVEHIPSYSPQARGRSKRMNRTLQDRLVNELRVAGIVTPEAANGYLRERYLPTHNEEFAREPADPTRAFAELGDVDLDEIFSEEGQHGRFRGRAASDREAGRTAYVRWPCRPEPPPPRRWLHRSPRDPASRRLRCRGPPSPGSGEDTDAPGCPRIDRSLVKTERTVHLPTTHTRQVGGRRRAPVC
jgi:hypothetical protein